MKKLLDIVDVVLFNGQDKESSLERIRNLVGDSTVCCKPFGDNCIVYICRTCQTDSTCAVCFDCFNSSDHEGHDYAVTMVCAGCCDCGDPQGWKTPCSKHAPSQTSINSSDVSVSSFFLRVETVARFLVSYVISSLQKYMDSSSSSTVNKVSRLLKSTINWIIALSKQGSLFMQTLTKTLIDTDNDHSISAVSHFLSLLMKPRSFPVESIAEFIITFSCDPKFRGPMLASLAPIYSELRSMNCPLLDSLTVQVFVSSLSVPDLISNNFVLHLLKAFHTAFFRNSQPRQFQWRTVDVSRHNTAFYEIACDLKYVFKHTEAIFSFFQCEESQSVFVEVLCLLQWISPCKRKTGAHVEFEDDNWMYAFELEIEIHELIEFFLKGLSKIPFDTVKDGMLSLLAKLSSKLLSFFNYSTEDVSFHIPLHRAFVVLLSSYRTCLQPCSVRQALDGIVSVNLVSGFLDGLCVAPIRIQSTLAQMSAGLWKKNGEFSEQAEFIYRGSGFSLTALYPDLLCIQISAAGTVEPDGWLSFAASFFDIAPSAANLEMRICEDFLRLMIAVFCEPVDPLFCGSDLLKRELIAQLAISEHGLAHSELLDRLPSKFTDDQEFPSILREISYFKAPSGTSSGRYCLKPSLYCNFDPFFFRLIQNDMTIAETRFHSLCQSSTGSPAYCVKLYQVSEDVQHILFARTMHSILCLLIRFCLNCDNQHNPERFFRSVLYILTLDASTTERHVFQSNEVQIPATPSCLLSNDLKQLLVTLSKSTLVQNNAELKHALARLFALTRNSLPESELLLAGFWSVDQHRESRRARIRAWQTELLDNFSRKRHAFESNVNQSNLPAPSSSGSSRDDQICLLCFEKSTSRKPLGAVAFVSVSHVPYMAHRKSSDRFDFNGVNASNNSSSSCSSTFAEIEDVSATNTLWRRPSGEHGIGRRRIPHALTIRQFGRHPNDTNTDAAAFDLNDDGFESINMRQLLEALNRAPNGLNAVEEELGDLLVSIFRRWTNSSTSGSSLALDFNWRSKSGCLFVQSCGHHICRPCFASYIGAQPPRFSTFRMSTFQCPVCRRLSNLHFPIPHQRFASASGQDQMPSLDEWIRSAISSSPLSPNRPSGSQNDHNLVKAFISNMLKYCNLRAPPPSVPASAVMSLLLGNIFETVDISLHDNVQGAVPRCTINLCKLLLDWIPVCFHFETPATASRSSRRPPSIIKVRTFIDQVWQDIFQHHGRLLHCNIFGTLIQLLPCLLSSQSTARNIFDLMQLAQLVQAFIFAFYANIGIVDRTFFPMSLCASNVASCNDLIIFVYGVLYTKRVTFDSSNTPSWSGSASVPFTDILTYGLSLCKPFARKASFLSSCAGFEHCSIFLDGSQLDNLHQNINRLLSSALVRHLLVRWLSSDAASLSSDIAPLRRVTRSLSPLLPGKVSIETAPIATALDHSNFQNMSNLLLKSSFRLASLPKRFDTLLAVTRNQRCDMCDKRTSEQFCICLLCGSILCWANTQECSFTHCAMRCDANSSIFLLLKDCVVAVAYNRTTAIWGSLYLDCHGEEDRELSRGLALYLQDDRVRDLTSLYTSVGIADFIARSHRDNIGIGGQATMMFNGPMMFI